MYFSLLPSLPAQSFDELESLAQALLGTSTELQIDIVDGLFVPLTSWPFLDCDGREKPDFENEFKRIKTLPTAMRYEIDCMVEKPEQYLDIFFSIGIHRVIIHYGSTSEYEAIINRIHDQNGLVGLAFTNDIDQSAIMELVPRIDFIQVMGIANVGKQGQPFDSRTMATIAEFRAQFPDLEIAVDGAVNIETIPLLLQAGANRFAPGSAIAKAENPLVAYKQLQKLLPQ